MWQTAPEPCARLKLVSLTIAAFLLASLCRPSIAMTTGTSLTIGSAAPDFSRPDLHQREVPLSAYRGKVVLLDFWATWCAPCLTEIPHLIEWQRTYGGHGFQIIGVAMDDTEAPVRAADKKYRLNYPVVMGDAKLGEIYGGVLDVPFMLLIDRGGEIRFKHEGVTNPRLVQSEIQMLLAKH